VERDFDFKDITKERKVKLVALKLRKYASLWCTNLCPKRVKLRKDKIRTWNKMKAKLRSWFLPPSYVQDIYSLLHHVTQGTTSIGKYTREFGKLMIKCDLQETKIK